MLDSVAEKLERFERQIVFFESYRTACALLHKSLESTKLRGVPNCALIVGPSGCGKSTLCNYFCNTFPKPSIELGPDGAYHTLPAFFCTVPAKVTIKSFAKTLLLGLECTDLRGDTVDLELRVIELLKTRHAELAIFDEIQILADPDTERTANDVIKFLLGLLNRTNIPIFLSGTEECKEVIYKDPKLARRYPFLIELHPFTFDTNASSEYISTLAQLDKMLYQIAELAKGTHLTDTKISAGLFIASGGNLEYLRMIIANALLICLRRDDHSLRPSDFSEASSFLTLNQSLCSGRNPFELTLNECYRLLESL